MHATIWNTRNMYLFLAEGTVATRVWWESCPAIFVLPRQIYLYQRKIGLVRVRKQKDCLSPAATCLCQVEYILVDRQFCTVSFCIEIISHAPSIDRTIRVHVRSH